MKNISILNKVMRGTIFLRFQLAVILIFLTNTYISAQEAKPELPKGKQTTLGLYVTAAEAYEMWKANPEKVKILDVRVPEEYVFVGHPEMAYNIPLVMQTYEWDPKMNFFKVAPNPDFMPQVKALFKPDDIILATCRSGGRGAMAVNALAAAGYKNVYNITDGIEGDEIADPASLYNGKRMKNGWKNAGIPWTYAVNPDLMKLPK
jgi:rhodanese-related sulfurtransferase